MNAFDWLLLSVILLSVISAIAQGFFAEVFSLGGTIVGLVLACWQYLRLAPWFEQYVKSSALANAVAFLVIVTAVNIIASIGARVATWMMKEAGLRWVDRALGGAFGLVKGLVLATVVVLVATAFVPTAAWLQGSTMAGYFSLSARAAVWLAPEGLRSTFHEGLAHLRKARQDAMAKAGKSDAGDNRQ